MAVEKDNQHRDRRKEEEVEHVVDDGEDDEDDGKHEEEEELRGAVVDNAPRQRLYTEACRGDAMESVVVLHYYNREEAEADNDEKTVVVVGERVHEHAEVDRHIHKHRNAKQQR